MKVESVNGGSGRESRSNSIEKHEELSTSSGMVGGKEKSASACLDATREVGTAATSVTAIATDEEKQRKDDDEFPDGGTRAWLVVFGVSLLRRLATTVLIMMI